MALLVKNLLASAEDARGMGSTPGPESSPGEGNDNHPSILAWEIPWTEEHGDLQCIGWQRVRHNSSD